MHYKLSTPIPLHPWSSIGQPYLRNVPQVSQIRPTAILQRSIILKPLFIVLSIRTMNKGFVFYPISHYPFRGVVANTLSAFYPYAV